MFFCLLYSDRSQLFDIFAQIQKWKKKYECSGFFCENCTCVVHKSPGVHKSQGHHQTTSKQKTHFSSLNCPNRMTEDAWLAVATVINSSSFQSALISVIWLIHNCFLGERVKLWRGSLKNDLSTTKRTITPRNSPIIEFFTNDAQNYFQLS